jgi:hypothetical protein
MFLLKIKVFAPAFERKIKVLFFLDGVFSCFLFKTLNL